MLYIRLGNPIPAVLSILRLGGKLVSEICLLPVLHWPCFLMAGIGFVHAGEETHKSMVQTIKDINAQVLEGSVSILSVLLILL